MAKKLLNENTVRRFMKLADMGSVGSQFIEENYQGDLEEGMPVYDRDEEEDLGGEDLGGELAPEEPALDVEPLEGDEATDDEDLIRALLNNVGELAQRIGVDVEVEGEGDDELGGELDDELGGELDDELGVEEEELEEQTDATKHAATAGKATGKAAASAAKSVSSSDEVLKQAAASAPVEPRAGSKTKDLGSWKTVQESKKQEKLADSILNLLEASGVEVVDDEKIKDDLVKEVTLRVAKRILKEKF